jgi:lipoyl(octanoyl) transferase
MVPAGQRAERAVGRAQPILVRDLGRVEYADAFARMREFTGARSPDTGDEIWVVEHPPVFTLGLAGRAQHVLAPAGIPVLASDRGGQVTYHGPGQVVAYTLIDLHRAGYFVRELVYRIEQSVIQVLEGLGIDGRRVKGAPGVYVPYPAGGAGPKASQPQPQPQMQPQMQPQPEERFRGLAKIAALGIKVSRGRSYHGVAFNVDMDLAPFRAIDPCGYPGLLATDLATLGVAISRADAAARLCGRLLAHL